MSNLVEQLINDTVQTSLHYFAPELAICVTIVCLLFVRLFSADKWLPPHWVALSGTLIAFGFAYLQFMALRQEGDTTPHLFFTGMLVFDQFTVFFRLFLLLFLILVIALTVLSGIPDNEDSPDFYSLLLGSTIGMMLMASANHLLILFLGVEMTSVPSYVMVGFLKGRRLSSEAALKYVVYGAGAAGVMLYGTSLIAGLLGTASFMTIGADGVITYELAQRIGALVGTDASMSNAAVQTVVLGVMMVLVGLAFKLSIVPFHFWCPDAFEGASAEVAGFLSVASKAGAFALLVRFCLAFVGSETEALADVYLHLGIGIGVIAAISATFGNLAAYAQTNVKRLLAYSTIAHAGYMLMAVAAMMVVLNGPAVADVDPSTEARRCIEGLLYYLFVYLFMNLGAFAIVALIRNHTFSEEIEDYNGLAHQAPVLCVCMGVCLFSLVGMPPLGGFVGKFMIFASLFKSGYVHWSMWIILAIGGINTVFSLFYYIRVLKAMFMAPLPEGAKRFHIPANSILSVYVMMISLPILALGMTNMIQGLSETAQSVASGLFR